MLRGLKTGYHWLIFQKSPIFFLFAVNRNDWATTSDVLCNSAVNVLKLRVHVRR